MARPDNYAIQARQAKDRFLTYDQEKLITKFGLKADPDWLYVSMLGQTHRISRKSGDMERLTDAGWISADSHGEVMTLLDLLCDSREDRFLSGRWKAMTAFGQLFHRSLAEEGRDPWADRFEADPDGFRRACLALGGQPVPQGDMAYAVELFDGLRILVQLWFGDEEFPANLRFLWDENTPDYIRYETMWYAKGMLLKRLEEEMT